MNQFRVIVVALIGFLSTASAQQDADARYVAIYNIIQQADNLVEGNQPKDALNVYLEAETRLENFQKLFPNWDSGIIAYRLSDLQKKIAALKVSTAPRKVEVISVLDATNPAATQAQAEASELSVQLQTARLENQNLQAKLKEALATQPAAVDASELAAAQSQLRELQKQNELLQNAQLSASVKRLVVTNTDEISKLNEQLAAAAKKYADEHSRAQMLVEENAALQKNLARGSSANAALTVLQSENDRLKSQLTALRSASDGAAAVTELSQRLQDARSQIARLQAAATLANLEKAGLENKVRKLSTQLAESAANFDARLSDLTQQRTDLLRKLELANAKNSSRNVSAAAAQLAALNKEVETLRARIAVDDSKAVPYSAEELALFRERAPGIEPMKHSVKELPAGAAALVASAQRHFSKREFAEAEADYAKILTLDANNALALANLATIELQQGKLDNAEKHLKAALAQSPDDAYNLSTLGFLKFRQQKHDEALDSLSRAAKIDPNNPEIQNYLGVTLSHKGQRVAAETALRKALQLDATYAPAHNNLAVIYLSQTPSLPQLARWHYQKALATGQPRNSELEKMLADKGAPVASEAPVQ